MAKAKKTPSKVADPELQPAVIDEVAITETLTTNYMPYAMSVIVSRAIPEIDGFKPSHRKLLYTMYKMGLLTAKDKTKSANVVGQTMKLNPHGDGAIYETMVRLAKGNESLLHPFIDSKGNFGKVYSRDMAYAASRYTEVKLDPICGELFEDIDRDSVDFVPNYDNTLTEPTLLPTRFPNVLVSANQGIAVGMASYICGFNLGEVCRTTVELIKNPDHDIFSTLIAPDLPTGGDLIYDRRALEQIYETGRGTVKVRSKWQVSGGVIEITEIPYSTSVEAIMDKVSELIKNGKVKEISDMRDETDLNGLKLAIDLKRGTDPDKLMRKLFKSTPLEDSLSCNFNILIAGTPQVLGVKDILTEWIAWRTECVRRRVHYDLTKKKEKYHLLLGLKQILLDIDRAISIIRHTEEDAEVIPNLMIGFGIDEVQAEYIAEIKLRNINKEYILKRLEETDELKKEIERLEAIVKSKAKLLQIIVSELNAVEKKFSIPRKTAILYADETEDDIEDEAEPTYPVNLFMTRDGYFKKITNQSLRMSGEQKLKEGDVLVFTAEAQSGDEIIFLTNLCSAYKARLNEFDDTKASVFGDYLPSKLGMEKDEIPVFAFLPGDYTGSLVYVFENGKCARIPMEGFATKSNRRRLTGAVSDKSKLVQAFAFKEDLEIAIQSSGNRLTLVSTALIPQKATRDTQGVQVLTLKTKQVIDHACAASERLVSDPKRYRAKAIPSAGAIIKPEDQREAQLTLV